MDNNLPETDLVTVTKKYPYNSLKITLFNAEGEELKPNEVATTFRFMVEGEDIVDYLVRKVKLVFDYSREEPLMYEVESYVLADSSSFKSQPVDNGPFGLGPGVIITG